MISYEKNLIKILKLSEKEAYNLNHKYIGTEHFLLAILKSNNEIKNILNKYSIDYENIYNEIKKIKIKSKTNNLIYTPLLKRLLIISNESGIVNTKNLFIKLLENGEGIAFSLINNNIDIRKIYKELLNYNNLQYGINLNKNIREERLIGRKKEFNEIIEILSRKNKSNPILVGKAGVGKTALIEELAYKINKKEVPKNLLNKQIISINISELLSGTRYRGEFEEKLNNIIKEFEVNNNLILFIDEIHLIVGAGSAEGAIDAANILKPALARNKIKCIGATTEEEYNKSIVKDKALNRRFHKVIINEPTIEETINILNKSKKYYEKYHNVHINKKQIELIVNLSNKYLKEKYNPDKSFDLLDKICTKTKLLNNDYSNNTRLKIEKLQKEKYQLLKNKQFKKAIDINKKIINIKNNKSIINVNNKLIENCFDITENNLGFKTS